MSSSSGHSCGSPGCRAAARRKKCSANRRRSLNKHLSLPFDDPVAKLEITPLRHPKSAHCMPPAVIFLVFVYYISRLLFMGVGLERLGK